MLWVDNRLDVCITLEAILIGFLERLSLCRSCGYRSALGYMIVTVYYSYCLEGCAVMKRRPPGFNPTLGWMQIPKLALPGTLFAVFCIHPGLALYSVDSSIPVHVSRSAPLRIRQVYNQKVWSLAQVIVTVIMLLWLSGVSVLFIRSSIHIYIHTFVQFGWAGLAEWDKVCEAIRLSYILVSREYLLVP
jgi:hypothetical protein